MKNKIFLSITLFLGIMFSLQAQVSGTPYVFENNQIAAICDGSTPTTVVDITSSTGKVWMDRNLGASRVATSATDYYAYGCLYQWGRGNDGHASIIYSSSSSASPINGSTATLSTTDTPGNALFITVTTSPVDWRSPQNNSLWQGVGSINNPCNAGYHVPTSAELIAEFTTYSITNAATAYTNGPSGGFKFVLAGYRDSNNATPYNQGTFGGYWSSTVNGNGANYRGIGSGITRNAVNFRSGGMSVRCLKD